MVPLIVLLIVFVIAFFVIKSRTKRPDWQAAGRIAMSVMLVFTAVSHFVFTEGMVQMIPDVFPFKTEIVYMTGILEILFAIGLLIPKYRTLTAWLLIAFFLAVLPANIKAAMENINYQTGKLNGNGINYLWFRVPLQLFYIAWVYFTSIRESKAF